MKHTLLMRFAAPMQSWGTRSRFDERDSELEPSKSGVIGLICAAQGIDRSETKPVIELAKLRMGVRVDKEGTLQRDYHTAKDIVRADGKGIQRTAVSNRYFLSDAIFLVGLEGENKEYLEKLNTALKNPYYPLFFGRKSFVPSQPIFLKNAVVDNDLKNALTEYPFLGIETPKRLVIESKSKSGALRMDQPISSFVERKFGARFVEMESYSSAYEAKNVPF